VRRVKQLLDTNRHNQGATTFAYAFQQVRDALVADEAESKLDLPAGVRSYVEFLRNLIGRSARQEDTLAWFDATYPRQARLDAEYLESVAGNFSPPGGQIVRDIAKRLRSAK
jgi:hypothetical protein